MDNKPIVMTHACALTVGTPEGRTEYLEVDLRDPDRMLNSDELRAVLDLAQPVASCR